MKPLKYPAGAIDSIFLMNGFSYQDSPFGRVIKYEMIHSLSECVMEAILKKPFRLIGVEFAYLRFKLELTQGELAKLLGVEDQTISLWERGESRIPKTSDVILRQLFIGKGRKQLGRRKLKCSVEDFLDYAQNEGKCTYQLFFEDEGWECHYVKKNEKQIFVSNTSFALNEGVRDLLWLPMEYFDTATYNSFGYNTQKIEGKYLKELFVKRDNYRDSELFVAEFKNNTLKQNNETPDKRVVYAPH